MRGEYGGAEKSKLQPSGGVVSVSTTLFFYMLRGF